MEGKENRCGNRGNRGPAAQGQLPAIHDQGVGGVGSLGGPSPGLADSRFLPVSSQGLSSACTRVLNSSSYKDSGGLEGILP